MKNMKGLSCGQSISRADELRPGKFGPTAVELPPHGDPALFREQSDNSSPIGRTLDDRRDAPPACYEQERLKSAPECRVSPASAPIGVTAMRPLTVMVLAGVGLARCVRSSSRRRTPPR